MSREILYSLLSGHLGSANELAGQVSTGLGATPVLTTATDVKPAFCGRCLCEEEQAVYFQYDTCEKKFQQNFLAGFGGFISELPVEGAPRRAVYGRSRPLGIYVGVHYDRQPFEQTLWLIPRCITAGIGCRKGTTAGAVEELSLRKSARSTAFFMRQLHRWQPLI